MLNTHNHIYIIKYQQPDQQQDQKCEKNWVYFFENLNKKNEKVGFRRNLNECQNSGIISLGRIVHIASKY